MFQTYTTTTLRSALRTLHLYHEAGYGVRAKVSHSLITLYNDPETRLAVSHTPGIQKDLAQLISRICGDMDYSPADIGIDVIDIVARIRFNSGCSRRAS